MLKPSDRDEHPTRPQGVSIPDRASGPGPFSTGRRSFQEAYRHFAQVTDLAQLALDPDALFDDTRESIPGRDIRF